MRSILCTLACVVCSGCGSIDGLNSSTQAVPTPSSSSFVFSGSVQRAFEITVNGNKFADSEDFYTKFIDELILTDSEYAERFQDGNIEVEGTYGVSTFGSRADVFISAQNGDGYSFEARTDSSAKFKVEVPQAAEGSYKARVVTRIGLKLTSSSGDTSHYCYLLHSIRDNVEVSASAKPIIFDEFSTQLTSYNCNSQEVSKLIIPEDDTCIPVEYEGEISLKPCPKPTATATATATPKVKATPKVTPTATVTPTAMVTVTPTAIGE